MGETARGVAGVAAAMSARRRDRIGHLYERHAAAVLRLVGGRVNAPQAVIEDACHTAWLRLCARDDVALDARSVVRWLVVTATRESWRRTSGKRELALGGWLTDGAERELPEPIGDAPDPSTIAAERDLVRRRLAALSTRELQFLALQALGLSYDEISAELNVTVRTVQRQILRGRRKLRDGGDTA